MRYTLHACDSGDPLNDSVQVGLTIIYDYNKLYLDQSFQLARISQMRERERERDRETERENMNKRETSGVFWLVKLWAVTLI